MTPVLQAVGLGKTFGGVRALDNIDLHVAPNEVLGIIGPNGAGKTTLFNLISRTLDPTDGDVLFHGRSIRRFRQHQAAASGIARTFQNLQVFGTMTVLENVMVGAHNGGHSGMFGALLRSRASRRDEVRLREMALGCLDRVGLVEYAGDVAENLPMGLQRHLELARALASDPAIILLDEPAAGLTSREAAALSGMISGLRDDAGMTFALIEHDMSVVMNVSDRVVVIDQGRKLAEGTPAEVQADPRVLEAYLGGEVEG